MKKVTIELYSINELNKEAKQKAINEHKSFLIDSYDDGMFDESFDMTRSKYAKQLLKDEIIGHIEINNYLFLKNGEMAHTLQYMKNNKCEKHVFILKDVEYIIE
jgi:uncharacterized membrane protein